ncbi:hypothetical protein EDC94DRAFT_699014 [Helicostylum pulchrum]|nr:hypothetical protein EDC94DRAFT_699014 [Helicostylum pulchrum]
MIVVAQEIDSVSFLVMLCFVAVKEDLPEDISQPSIKSGRIKNGKVSLRSIKGTFVCNNKKCLLQKLSATHKARDAVSALAIGLSGAASLILDIAFPSFDPNTSQSKTERFKNTAVASLKRNASRPAFPK